ncbi:MAG: tetratricopeptide repeat protein [Methanomethylovorans sp.]|uniref:tetratricopeptide repeat protein n=1 Tax=Methanomethylovorans sp. TaxID=2758717 RepID=UPI003531091B
MGSFADSFKCIEDKFEKGFNLCKKGKKEEANCYFNQVIIDCTNARTESALENDIAITWLYEGLSYGQLGQDESAGYAYNKANELFREIIKCCENDANFWYYYGRSFQGLNKNKEAIEHFDRALKIQPDYYMALYEKGHIFHILGKRTEAFESFTELTKLKPDFDQGWCDKGIILYETNKYNEALPLFEKALQINAEYSGAWYYKGLTDYNLKNYKDAEFAFRKVLEINNFKDAGAWYYRGLCFLKQGKSEDALKSFEQATMISPEYEISWYELGLIQHKFGEYHKAIESFKKIKPKGFGQNLLYIRSLIQKGLVLSKTLDGWHKSVEVFNLCLKTIEEEFKVIPNAELWYYKGLCLQYTERDCITAYDKALEINPQYAYAWNSKGFSLLQSGKVNEAKDAFRNTISVLNSEHEFNENDGDLWYCKGLAFLYLDDYVSSREAFLKSLSIYPKDPDALNNIGLSYYFSNMYKEAINEFDKAREINDKFTYCLNNKGLAHYALEEYDQAIETFESVIKIENDNLFSLYYLGIVNYSISNYDLSIKYFDQVLAIKPDYIDAIYNKSIAKFELGRYDEAYESICRVISQMKPQDLNRSRFEELRLFCKNKLYSSRDIYEMGLKYLEQGKYNESLNIFEKLIKKYPVDSDVWNCKGIAYYMIGKYDKSGSSFEKALSIDPNNYYANINLAQLLLNVGSVDGANKVINQLLVKNPNMNEDSQVMDLIGEIKIKEHDYKNAIIYFEKAISSAPFNLRFFFLHSYTRFLISEFVHDSKQNKRYEELFLLICDMEKLNFTANIKYNAYALYLLGCCYYKINDLQTAISKFEQCLRLKSGIPVEEAARRISNNLWNSQIKPSFWTWWWNSPINRWPKRLVFLGISLLISILLLFHPLLSKNYTLLLDLNKAGSSSVVYSYINWNIYILSIFLLVFILLFPSIKRIKGTDVEIELQAPPLPIEFNPLMPTFNEPLYKVSLKELQLQNIIQMEKRYKELGS